jgi:small multidrug resistance pump
MKLDHGRRFLVAAGAYNAAWGIAAIGAPARISRAVGFPASGDGMGWRAAGVVVLAYAPAYLWAAARPREARPILATALFGKSIGAVGWFAGLASGRFSRRTVVLPLLNDLIWLPGLVRLLRRAESGSTPPSRRQAR